MVIAITAVLLRYTTNHTITKVAVIIMTAISFKIVTVIAMTFSSVVLLLLLLLLILLLLILQ